MAKVRAVIEADSGTLLVDFPQGIYALYEKLRSVGIRHSPSNIPIADEEDGAIRVKLYAEDDVGKRLTLLFSEDNTLAEVNTTAFVMENTDPEIRPQLEENLLHGRFPDAVFHQIVRKPSHPVRRVQVGVAGNLAVHIPAPCYHVLSA